VLPKPKYRGRPTSTVPHDDTLCHDCGRTQDKTNASRNAPKAQWPNAFSTMTCCCPVPFPCWRSCTGRRPTLCTTPALICSTSSTTRSDNSLSALSRTRRNDSLSYGGTPSRQDLKASSPRSRGRAARVQPHRPSHRTDGSPKQHTHTHAPGSRGNRVRCRRLCRPPNPTSVSRLRSSHHITSRE